VRGVTARAVVIGVVLTPLNVLALVRSCYALGWTTGNGALFVNALAGLFLIALINRGVRAWRPARALGAGELLTVYVMLEVGTGLVGGAWDVGGSLASTITYPFWFATEENHWRDLIWPVLPTWLTVQDRSVIAGFYMGASSPYSPAVLRAWAGPALWWAAIVGAMMWVCLCLNCIVRRRWEDEERLPFPLVTLPVQLVEERFGLLRSKLFWVGVGLAIGVEGWNSLARFVPSLVQIPVFIDYTAYVEHRHAWSLMRYPALLWSPFPLGLCYLMPLDLTFSLLAFDLMWTAEYVVSGHFGWATDPWSGFPYGDQQVAGALAALLLAMVWLDRRYLAQVVRRALGLRSVLREDGREAFSYRWAMIGVVAGVAFLWWIMARSGAQSWAAVSVLAMYFAMCLVLSRVRAQLGPPAHELPSATMPDSILLALAGSRPLGPRTLGMLTLLRPFLLLQGSNPTPAQLEALKMAEGGRMERRRIALAMAATAPLAIICYFWAQLHVGYSLGLGSGKTHHWNLVVPRWLATDLDGYLRHPAGPNTPAVTAMGFGLIITTLLTWLKLRFLWWPLHPVAFPIALSWAIGAMKPALFISWLTKSLLLRYGGLRAHRTALPFFLGLLAGGATYVWVQRVAFLLLGIPP
jgi:hypothetical protein